MSKSIILRCMLYSQIDLYDSCHKAGLCYHFRSAITLSIHHSTATCMFPSTHTLIPPITPIPSRSLELYPASYFDLLVGSVALD
jgi:hypothetical protein